LAEHYLAVSVAEMRDEEYGPAPWTQTQTRFAQARQRVRLLKGHPGSGKTTALWHAADSSGAERILYVTYSRDLAALARDYFDRYCSSHKHFDVIVFPQLVRRILGSDTPVTPEKDMRQRFSQDLGPYVRGLGPWGNNLAALYEEIYAHLVGEALPVSLGRFKESRQPRVPDRAYREHRTRFLGPQGVAGALEAASRLERGAETLADRYFPELALAWRAMERLKKGGGDGVPLDFDCMAVDEVQDLVPIEAMLLIELCTMAFRRRKTLTSLLIAGDEAQTVRPTDFEWAWLSDLLHHSIGTPSEHKLSANLRSPRRIADLVNRVWDLYSFVLKEDRPRGSGQAEIEDDAADQILYCTAAPGPELDELLTLLAAREGVALIALGEAASAFIPQSVRPAVLTVAEAKGLDFHTVCVIDPGRQVRQILEAGSPTRADSGLLELRKRLAIDQLRVAVSRPWERLVWLDIDPSDQVVGTSLDFINADSVGSAVSASVPAAITKTFQEEELDAEERVQRCQADARQYLEVKPEMAWSRAHQAVALLGRLDTPAAITDQAVRDAALLTLAEICFLLGVRHTRMPAELGNPNLFAEAAQAALEAQREGLATVIRAIGRLDRAPASERLQALSEFARVLPRHKSKLESWVLVEVAAQRQSWLETLETGSLLAGWNSEAFLQVLPAFYEALDVPDAAERLQGLRQRAIQALVKDRYFEEALRLLAKLERRDPKLEALCYEGIGNLRGAAESFQRAGDLKNALRCFRAVPDFAAALEIVRRVPDHPAAASLEWLARVQSVVAERPDKFTRTVTDAEKKFLEDMLEQALGVKRRKPAPKPARKSRSKVERPPQP
jgi:tetratricopeptide (TPR) repeat protein